MDEMLTVRVNCRLPPRAVRNTAPPAAVSICLNCSHNTDEQGGVCASERISVIGGPVPTSTFWLLSSIATPAVYKINPQSSLLIQSFSQIYCEKCHRSHQSRSCSLRLHPTGMGLSPENPRLLPSLCAFAICGHWRSPHFFSPGQYVPLCIIDVTVGDRSRGRHITALHSPYTSLYFHSHHCSEHINGLLENLQGNISATFKYTPRICSRD
ncbi:hypothetical protein A0H81_05145 [Grifola frondosa]|uniref:Uncharacterized protein n=1 Tax=Grifola frondosa TaxID=5627 RepID=A0A1C7MDI2_GRIFR|nr:hypothetical protein A0H81_05145 [Grifola frondosa]